MNGHKSSGGNWPVIITTVHEPSSLLFVYLSRTSTRCERSHLVRQHTALVLQIKQTPRNRGLTRLHSFHKSILVGFLGAGALLYGSICSIGGQRRLSHAIAFGASSGAGLTKSEVQALVPASKSKIRICTLPVLKKLARCFPTGLMNCRRKLYLV